MAHFAQHLDVVGDTFHQAFGFELLGLAHEVVVLLAEVKFDLAYCRAHAFGRCDKEIGGIDLEYVVGAERDIVRRVEGLDRLYLIAPEGDAHNNFFISEPNVNGVAFDTECATRQFQLVARVERIDERPQEFVACDFLSDFHSHHIAVEVFGVAHAVEA